jgi:hypothetical protein
MAKKESGLKTYTLEIVYDSGTDTIEYIKEYISCSDAPAFIPMPDKIGIPAEYWDDMDSDEVGES